MKIKLLDKMLQDLPTNQGQKVQTLKYKECYTVTSSDIRQGKTES